MFLKEFIFLLTINYVVQSKAYQNFLCQESQQNDENLSSDTFSGSPISDQSSSTEGVIIISESDNAVQFNPSYNFLSPETMQKENLLSEGFSESPVNDYSPKISKQSKFLNENVMRISEKKCHEYKMNLQKIRKKGNNFRKTAVVGGTNTSIMFFPHMGALGWESRDKNNPWLFLCGSFLISNEFVLTAAHCTFKPMKSDKRIAVNEPTIVRFGTTNINVTKSYEAPFKIDAQIAKIIKHPRYQSPKQIFDIALIRFTKPVEMNALIYPVCLWNKYDFDGVPIGTVTGWGMTSRKSSSTSSYLQKANVDIIKNEDCKILLSHNRNFGGLEDHQLCAGKLHGSVDTCSGDSGGPLQIQVNSTYYVIGVTSFGYGCARPGSPGVYTRVFSFIDWIEREVWKNE